MARKTKEDMQQTRRDIIDAARNVFSERGVSRTSLEQIASAAGVTRGAVYWHFENKAQLFVALRDDVAMPLMDVLEAALQVDSGSDPLGAIECFLMAYVERLESDLTTRQTFEVLINKCEYTGELGDALKCVMRRSHDLSERLRVAYQKAAEKGGLRASLDPDAMARDTYAFLFGLVRLWIVDREDNEFRTAARDMIRTHIALRRT